MVIKSSNNETMQDLFQVFIDNVSSFWFDIKISRDTHCCVGKLGFRFKQLTNSSDSMIRHI